MDPRYDNVEVYHSFEFGLQLKGILAGSEVLQEKLVPQFKLTIADDDGGTEFTWPGIITENKTDSVEPDKITEFETTVQISGAAV